MSLTKDVAKPARKTTREKSSAGELSGMLAQIDGARALMLIALLAIVAYANSLGGDFVFDDTEQIVENQNIRSWSNLGKAFTTHVWAFRERAGTRAGSLDVPPPLPYYRPLFTVMLTVEYHLFGLWPQGWHLVSLLLHILCAAGVFYVILVSSGQRLVALLASALFAVYPIHSESVAWISGMTDPLFGVFFLASFYLYLKYRSSSSTSRPRGSRDLVLSLVSFAFAAFAKETALSLVLLIFGYEFAMTPGRKVQRLIAPLKACMPYLVTALFYLLPRYLVLRELMWHNPQAASRPLSHVLLTLPLVLCTYAAHLIWPFGLSVTYQTSFVTNVASPGFLAPAAILFCLISVLTTFRSRLTRDVWLALLFIIVPLLPVLNLGEVSQDEYLVFDHYLYLPAAGVSYLIALGLARLAGRELTQRKRSFSTASIVTAIMLVVGLTIANARENQAWANSDSLWSNAARVRPGYWAPHYNVGLSLLDSHRFEEARIELARAASLKSDAPEVFDALGRAYEGTGDNAAAISSFEHALSLDPGMVESLNNLGTVYFKRSDFPAAEKYFAAALLINPRASTALFNLGLCYSRSGNSINAIRQFERVRDLGFADDEVFYELGLAYEKAGRLKEAVAALERAREITRSKDLSSRIQERLDGIRTSL